MINRTLHDPDIGAIEASGSASSGVSWGAILAGAFAAAALSFILVILGFGLGFSSVSPWSGSGLSAQTIGYSTIGWITFTQIAASAIGGYIAGRLRVKWANVHTEEVYFRDTAHGFLAWAVASLATAALVSGALGSVLSGGAKVASSAGAAVVASGTVGPADMAGYFSDSLFRPAPAASSAPAASAGPTGAPATPGSAGTPGIAPLADGRDNSVTPGQRAEVMRIFANALRTGALPDADKTYLAQLVARRTGMSQADAEKRVSDKFATYKQNIDDAATKAKSADDTARKAAAYGSLWMFVALLCGAFIASFTATYGGRLRDRVVFTAREPRVTDSNEPVTIS